MEWVRLDGFAAYREYRAGAARAIRRCRAYEKSWMAAGERFIVPGFCWVCQLPAELAVDYSYAYPVDGVLTPNWREHLLCPRCHLNNRMRATIHFFEDRLRPSPSDSIYLTEQTTPLFRCLAERYPKAVGSEYLGRSVAWGESAGGIRNESVTRLTFADASFDIVISLDVLEHVPDFSHALAECHRVLRPGGSLLLSVPFRPEWEKNQVRAIVDDQGETRHLLPPEYHGDPLKAEGCLAYYCFGWELLEQACAAGFSEALGYSFWSREYGYLGSDLTLFLARKEGA